MKFQIPVWLSVAIFLLGCDSRQEMTPTTVVATPTKVVRLPADQSFRVDFPSTPLWQKVNDGPVQGMAETHQVSVVNNDRQISLTVLVLPALPDQKTLKEMVPEWEAGLLKKMTKKKSSEFINLQGQEAYKVDSVVELADGSTLDVMTILATRNGRNFTVAVTKPSELAKSDPEIEAFLNSFHIR